jgi:3-isopropylmalate/(R)-2-methylmalate dehydratase large subunit
MGMTMTQKIMARHAGLDHVEAGEHILANLDLVMGNDITTPVAIEAFKEMGAKEVFDAEKIALVLDHFTPNKDIKAATQCKMIRDFAREMGITHFYDGGDVGIEHVILPEYGLVKAGDMMIGADSHTCTYGALGAFSTGVGSTDMAVGMATGKAWFRIPEAQLFALKGKPGKWINGKDLILYIIGMIGVDGARYQSMEFTGEGVSNLSMDDRFTIANMAIEAGGKNGIFPVDDLTVEYLMAHSKEIGIIETADADASYIERHEIDLSALEPMVAYPHLPENTRPASESGDITLDQVVIGSCTNGRISDLRQAAAILKGHKAAKDVRLLIIPGSQAVYKQAVDEGLVDIFIDARAIVGPPTCGPCLGGHMGVLAKGERALSTTNRNFVGRMGHPESEVYLASPAVAAASAIAGHIVHPDGIGGSHA